MEHNPIDRWLINSYEKRGRLGTAKYLVKKAGSAAAGAANTASRIVTKAVGGEKLAKYAGEKFAKATAPADRKKYVEQTVSGKEAAKSAGKVVLTSAGLLAGGFAGRVGKSLSGAIGKKLAKRRVNKVLEKSKNITDRMKKMPDYTEKSTKKYHDVAKK